MLCEARKISELHENPIDNCLIKLCEPVSNILRKLNITPNQITAVGLSMGLLSFLFIIKKQFYLAFIFFWISYYLDCLDGYYARKYNMVTSFGDYFDHLRDIIVLVLILGGIWVNLNKKQRIIYVIILALTSVCMNMHLGCQEKNSNTRKFNHCLGWMQMMCPDKNMIYFSRFFGSGSFILVVSLYILYLQLKKNNGTL